MSVLANEIYEHLSKTRKSLTKYQLQTKYNVNNRTVTDALDELLEDGRIVAERCSRNKQFCVKRPASVVIVQSIFKPYIPPASLVARQREIEAQRAEFPSRFN